MKTYKVIFEKEFNTKKLEWIIFSENDDSAWQYAEDKVYAEYPKGTLMGVRECFHPELQYTQFPFEFLTDCLAFASQFYSFSVAGTVSGYELQQKMINKYPESWVNALFLSIGEFTE